MRLNKRIRRSIIFVTVLFLTLGLTSCGTFDKAKDMADTAKEKFDEKVEEKKEEVAQQ